MPKKSKKFKRSSKKKKKGDKKITKEEEIKNYENKIAELNRQLAVLQTNVYKVESKNEQLENRLQSVGPGEKDIIAYLKHTVELNEKEIEKLKIKATATSKDMQNLDSCKAEIEQLEAEYQFMNKELCLRIDDLQNRLVALGKVGLIREEIMKKFEVQHKIKQNCQSIYKHEFYEAEKKLVLEKGRLKKEMDLRVEYLANNFHDLRDIRIAANTKRLVNSSITLHITYEDAIMKFKKLEKENKHLKEVNKKIRLKAALTRQERKMVVSKCNIQLQTITDLLESYEEVTEKINAYKLIETEVLELAKKLSNLLSITENLKGIVNVLEQNLHANRCKRNTLRTTLEYYVLEHDRLSLIANDCITNILYLLENKIITESKQTKLLYNIFSVVNLYQKEKIAPPEAKIVLSLSVMYKQGDFGFVPKPVHLILPTEQNREVMLSPSFYTKKSEPSFTKNSGSEMESEECESEAMYI